MEDVIQEIQQWTFLASLPAEINGFILKKQLTRRNTQFLIFCYENSGCHRSFSVLYDSETKDYLAQVVAGLTEYCDIGFIVGDLSALERVLSMRMAKTIHDLAVFNESALSSIVKDKKILEWTYAKQLPSEISGFELYIRPFEPLKVLNGAYIIIDYSDFAAESNLTIYYNVFRDDFFGELRLHRTPEMAAVFECKQLNELEEKIEVNLRPTLAEMRRRLTE
ncbi:MAG: hypothetical protein ABFC84_09600 [Veillonellales bacterium]